MCDIDGVNVDWWDCDRVAANYSGHELQELHRVAYPDADALLMTFDMRSRQSLDKIVSSNPVGWMAEITAEYPGAEGCWILVAALRPHLLFISLCCRLDYTMTNGAKAGKRVR